MNKNTSLSPARRGLLCALPLFLFLLIAVKMLLVKQIGYAPLLPYELSSFLGMSLLAERGWAEFSTVTVVLGYIGIAFIPAFLSFLGGYLYPQKRGWGLLLLLTPVGIEFCLSMLLCGSLLGASGMIMIFTNAVYATALIMISGIFHLPERRNEQKDLTFYDRY